MFSKAREMRCSVGAAEPRVAGGHTTRGVVLVEV